MDRNGNRGYKEEEQPGIAKLVVSAILGALLAFAKFIAELASGIFNWIYDFVESIFDAALSFLKKIQITIAKQIEKLFEGLFTNDFEKSKATQAEKISKFVDDLVTWIVTVAITLNMIGLTLIIIENVLNLVPLKAILAAVVGFSAYLIIALLAASVMDALGLDKLIGIGFIEKITGYLAESFKWQKWALEVQILALDFGAKFLVIGGFGAALTPAWFWGTFALLDSFVSLLIGDTNYVLSGAFLIISIVSCLISIRQKLKPSAFNKALKAGGGAMSFTDKVKEVIFWSTLIGTIVTVAGAIVKWIANWDDVKEDFGQLFKWIEELF